MYVAVFGHDYNEIMCYDHDINNIPSNTIIIVHANQFAVVDLMFGIASSIDQFH